MASEVAWTDSQLLVAVTCLWPLWRRESQNSVKRVSSQGVCFWPPKDVQGNPAKAQIIMLWIWIRRGHGMAPEIFTLHDFYLCVIIPYGDCWLPVWVKRSFHRHMKNPAVTWCQQLRFGSHNCSFPIEFISKMATSQCQEAVSTSCGHHIQASVTWPIV